MKKSKMIAAVLACMLVSTPISGFAETCNSKIAESGGMNVDYLLNQSNNLSMYNARSLPEDVVQYVGGGKFTVKWFEKNGAQAFSSKYEHNTKTHRASVTGQKYITSPWEPKGVVAFVWTYAGLFGNKANWDTK